MSARTSVQRLGPQWGNRKTPALSDYLSSSPGWAEIEYLANPTKSENIVGAWQGIGTVTFEHWPYDEVCVILTGRVAVEIEGEGVHEFGRGEAFLVLAGSRGAWHTLEPTSKIFVGLG